MSENTTTNQFEDSPNLSAEAVLPFDGFDVEVSESAQTAHCPTRPLLDGGSVADDENLSVDPEIVRAAYAREEGRFAYRLLKRMFDIVFSLGVIAVLLIPSLLLCLAIRLESPGNPIYSQKRVGRIGRGGEVETFDMYKFRSMHADADARLADLRDLNEADGPLFKIKDDPRVTRIGRFIRRHSIDELPQFANCLIGQLSCVGPRPPLPNEVAQYDGRAMRRLSVKPGLTGYWQVSGRSDTTFDGMVDLDLKYIEERGVLTDLRVIARTVGIMLTGGGLTRGAPPTLLRAVTPRG